MKKGIVGVMFYLLVLDHISYRSYLFVILPRRSLCGPVFLMQPYLHVNSHSLLSHTASTSLSFIGRTKQKTSNISHLYRYLGKVLLVLVLFISKPIINRRSLFARSLHYSRFEWYLSDEELSRSGCIALKGSKFTRLEISYFGVVWLCISWYWVLMVSYLKGSLER